MKGFILKSENLTIRFLYYLEEAPATSRAFDTLLPFERTFIHARISGQEIWIDDAPQIDIIQENASIFTEVGEVVYGPLKPKRVKTSNCMGIYYGEGKGLDACNIFARVMEEDGQLLKELGEIIWRTGQKMIRFEKMEE